MQNNFVFLKRSFGFLVALLALGTGTLQAHPFHSDLSGLAGGLVHPWLGLDHILAMAAVGFWAAQLGERARWLVPCSFVAMMCAGAGLGMHAMPVPFVEQAILASILVLGLLIAASVRLPLAAGMVLVGVFALFHGLAHGSEIAKQAFAFPYIVGFVFATAMLHLIGFALGLLAQRQAKLLWVRGAGVGVLAAGLLLVLK